MRLRVVDAPDGPTALARIRETLGPDAFIVTTKERPDGISVLAAVDVGEDELDRLLAPAPDERVAARIVSCLARHGVPPALIEALKPPSGDSAEDPAGDAEPVLARSLARHLDLTPLGPDWSRPLMLVGPPGAGKTAAVAKLATALVVAGQTVTVVTTDVERAGALAQLGQLLVPLGLEPHPAADPRTLAALCCRGDRVLIDSAAVNPFRGRDLARLAGLLQAARAEPVLVMAAGGAVEDAAETAGNLALIGARRMIATRLDMARSLGGLLAAADARLAIAAVGTSPLIGKPLAALSAAALARLLLRAQDRP
jgi:flagellar biosynthesis protein FlhF